jgi:lipopolysaccharide/colanic/teichoic acid biosynthesis glycosyltransferase
MIEPRPLQKSFLASFTRGARQAAKPNARRIWAHTHRKRIFDLSIALPAFVCSLPILILLALLIRATSAGPALFRQTRVGRNQRPFTIYKLRTMHQFAEFHGPSVTSKGDPRMTTLGYYLRRLKLDELPQLYNIIVGEMSFVGPRPKLAEHEQMMLPCRPGITGAATIVFTHEDEILANIPQEDVEQYMISVLNPIKARLDSRYVEEGTFTKDLQILSRTVLKLGRKNRPMDVRDLAELANAT